MVKRKQANKSSRHQRRQRARTAHASSSVETITRAARPRPGGIQVKKLIQFADDFWYSILVFLDGQDLLILTMCSKQVRSQVHIIRPLFPTGYFTGGEEASLGTWEYKIRRWILWKRDRCCVCFSSDTTKVPPWIQLTLCRDHRRHPSDSRFISKTYARNQFGLSMGDIKPLRSLNQMNSNLYLEDDVYYTALQKYHGRKNFYAMQIRKVDRWCRMNAMTPLPQDSMPDALTNSLFKGLKAELKKVLVLRETLAQRKNKGSNAFVFTGMLQKCTPSAKVIQSRMDQIKKIILSIASSSSVRKCLVKLADVSPLLTMFQREILQAIEIPQPLERLEQFACHMVYHYALDREIQARTTQQGLYAPSAVTEFWQDEIHKFSTDFELTLPLDTTGTQTLVLKSPVEISILLVERFHRIETICSFILHRKLCRSKFKAMEILTRSTILLELVTFHSFRPTQDDAQKRQYFQATLKQFEKLYISQVNRVVDIQNEFHTNNVMYAEEDPHVRGYIENGVSDINPSLRHPVAIHSIMQCEQSDRYSCQEMIRGIIDEITSSCSQTGLQFQVDFFRNEIMQHVDAMEELIRNGVVRWSGDNRIYHQLEDFVLELSFRAETNFCRRGLLLVHLDEVCTKEQPELIQYVIHYPYTSLQSAIVRPLHDFIENKRTGYQYDHTANALKAISCSMLRNSRYVRLKQELELLGYSLTKLCRSTKHLRGLVDEYIIYSFMSISSRKRVMCVNVVALYLIHEWNIFEGRAILLAKAFDSIASKPHEALGKDIPAPIERKYGSMPIDDIIFDFISSTNQQSGLYGIFLRKKAAAHDLAHLIYVKQVTLRSHLSAFVTHVGHRGWPELLMTGHPILEHFQQRGLPCFCGIEMSKVESLTNMLIVQRQAELARRHALTRLLGFVGSLYSPVFQRLCPDVYDQLETYARVGTLLAVVDPKTKKLIDQHSISMNLASVWTLTKLNDPTSMASAVVEVLQYVSRTNLELTERDMEALVHWTTSGLTKKCLLRLCFERRCAHCEHMCEELKTCEVCSGDFCIDCRTTRYVCVFSQEVCLDCQ